MLHLSSQKDTSSSKELIFFLGVLVFLISPGDFSEENPQAFKKIALTNHVRPRWSPDEKKIAYGSQINTKSKGATHIWIIDLEKQMGFVQIPFELISGYLVFRVPVEPSGSLSLLFDTGCQTANISKEALDRNSIEKTITLLLGNRKLKIDNFRLNPSIQLSKALANRIDGVIGNDILHRYTVKIDFKNKVLSLFDKEDYIGYPDGEDIEIEVNQLVSSVPLKIKFSGGQQIEGEFVIDTGAPINLIINSPVAEENGLYTILEKKDARKFKTQAAVQKAVAAMAEFVRIGRFECENMEVYISTSNEGLFGGTKYAGIVGNKFLQNFNVILDYKRNRLHIDKY